MNEFRPGTAQRLVFAYPLLMLGIFFVVPFALMLALSFFHRIEGGFYEPGFELASYQRFFSLFFFNILAFSIVVSALVALICVVIGFPFTYFITRLRRRLQIIYLVFILAVLSLSEVIVGFSWSILLSRTAGVTNLLVFLGLMAQPESWTPSMMALILGLCYLALPYSVLVLYPALSRLDPEIPEAARMLGASPLRAFMTVTVPLLRNAILATLVMVFVFTLGVYLLPQLLGRPQHWTLSVLITDQAIYQSNLPFAAAMAMFLLLVSLALISLILLLGKRGTA